MKKIKRRQSVGEEIANAVSHGIMTLIGILVLVFMIKKLIVIHHLPMYKYLSLLFVIAIILLYLMSCLYHSLAFTRAKIIFQKFDHISIYLLVVGTFAPILILLPSLKQKIIFDLSFGMIFFLFQITFAIIGISLKLFCISKWQRMHIFFFLLLGWSSLIILPYFNLKNNINPLLMILLFLGGSSYSGGVYFYIKDYKKYYHFVWHLCVVLGTLLHVWAIFIFLENL